MRPSLVPAAARGGERLNVCLCVYAQMKKSGGTAQKRHRRRREGGTGMGMDA